MAIRNIRALARRENGFYFNSPIAYIVITVFLLACAVVFFTVETEGETFFSANRTEMRRLFTAVPWILAFLVPAISMRLLSEEKRTGTIELLVTWPVTDRQIVFGKYLGGLSFLGIMLAATLPLVLIVATMGKLDFGLVVGGYLGLFLVGAAYLGIGLMTSSWTKNQIVAYLVGVLLCAFFYFIDSMLGLVWQDARDAFAFLSFKAHFDNIARGVIDLRDLAFYGTVIAVTLVVTSQSLQARNWKK